MIEAPGLLPVGWWGMTRNHDLNGGTLTEKKEYVSDEERAESFKIACATGTMVEWLRDPDNYEFASRLAKARAGEEME